MRKRVLCSLPTAQAPQNNRTRRGRFPPVARLRNECHLSNHSLAPSHAASARSVGTSLVRAARARSTNIATARCRALSKPRVRVVAAALFDACGKVLIAERPAGKHLAGSWEFPGGKIAPGESDAMALARELREELGVELVSGRPLLSLRHSYEDHHVELSMWIVERYDGEPRGLDGQRLKWVTPARLPDEDMLVADRPFIEALQQIR